MGLEIAEAFDWDPPDVVIYPTGGGVGLIGVWKAMRELAELGEVGAHLLRREAHRQRQVLRAHHPGARPAGHFFIAPLR